MRWQKSAMWGFKQVVIVTAGLCCALMPVWAIGGAVDSIYDPADLSTTLQHKYSSWFVGNEQHLGIFDEVIKPKFNDAERKKLANLPLEFLPNMPGEEPLGFFGNDGKIFLSVASLKFFDDLILAYAWLGRNHYSLDTVNDYMRMLRRWPERKPPPPEPLKALGVPDNALDDPGAKKLANLYLNNVYTFILLHELGHFYDGDYDGDPASWRCTPRGDRQKKEAAADSFALKLMGRMGMVPTGIAQFLTWASAYEPNRADYRNADDYKAAVQERSHPLETQRLTVVADDIDRNAGKYAIDHSPETLAKFRELAALERKLAMQLDDPGIQRDIARRAKMLEPRDLAPRRPNEMIGSRAGNGPFDGKLTGNVDGKPVEVVLENQSGRVTGTLGMGPELIRIEGAVEDETFSFSWKSADAEGKGELRRDGDAYKGTSSWPTKNGSVWLLTAVRLAGAPIPNIGGVWQDVNAPWNTTYITQHGEKFEFNRQGMLANGVGFESTGSGELQGQSFVANYSAEYQKRSRSTGECFGLVASDGRSLTENCTDSNYSFAISISAVRR